MERKCKLSCHGVYRGYTILLTLKPYELAIEGAGAWGFKAYGAYALSVWVWVWRGALGFRLLLGQFIRAQGWTQPDGLWLILRILHDLGIHIIIHTP